MLLKNIQFLRGAAAMAVVLYHLAPYFLNTAHILQGLHAFFVQFGYAGVDVFFVISGYVIWISTYGAAEHKTPGEFAYYRAVRIYLGYWPYLLIACVVLWVFSPAMFQSANFLGSFFLTELNIPSLILKVAWTLSFELYFYLILTLCLFFSKRLSQMILLLFAGLIILAQCHAVFSLNIYEGENIAAASSLYLFFLSPFCLQFLIGASIAMYFEKFRLKHLKIAFVLGLVAFAFTLWYQNQVLPVGHDLSLGYYIPIRVILYGFVAMVLVASLVELEKRGRLIWPKFGALLGDASYSLYLSHTIILFMLGELGFNLWGHTGEWQHLMTIMALMLIIVAYSVAHYRLLELPLMQWAKKKGRLFFRH